MNLDIKFVDNFMKSIPEFYRDILKSWIKAGGGQTRVSMNFINIRKQVIWGNKFITLNNKPLFYSNWINSKIIFINDVLDDKDILKKIFLKN